MRLNTLIAAKILARTIYFLGLVIGSMSAADATNNSKSANDAPIVLDKMEITSRRERIQAYDTNAAALWSQSEKDRKICYAEVILAAYDLKRFDLAKTLNAKKEYRETLGKARSFLCNYEAILTPVPIQYQSYKGAGSALEPSFAGLKTPTLADGASIGYSFKNRLILGDKYNPRTVYPQLMVASGMSLTAYNPSTPTMAKIAAIRGERTYSKRQRLFNLFCSDAIIESRLQDLNRFYGVQKGRPIMTPLEALEALIILGETPSIDHVERVFAENNVACPRAMIEATIASASGMKSGRFAEEFDGKYSAMVQAHRLVETLHALSGKDYERQLTLILIEAPGHI
jgi:hypothetical protein